MRNDDCPDLQLRLGVTRAAPPALARVRPILCSLTITPLQCTLVQHRQQNISTFIMHIGLAPILSITTYSYIGIA